VMWPENIFLLDFALVPEMLIATDLNNALIKRTNLERITAL
jgi:hypothetical protein